MSDNTLILNEAQTRASLNITKFLDNSKSHNFLLLGMAGSGKTTVIVNAFNGRSLKIAFCAFTNKATQVLCKIADKFSISFQADFMTIHVLLRLEVKYNNKETDVSFTFDKNKLEHLKNYDVIIFDECSTISSELYKYICEAHEHINLTHDINLKYIFLGDFWQLPPIGEEKSVIFTTATAEKWAISKLEKVMRSANDTMLAININMLDWIPKFKTGDVADFITKYPYNLVPKKLGSYLSLDDMIDQYMLTWTTVTKDCIILTYSNANCHKTNQLIQDKVDEMASRGVPKKREVLNFYVGDRCCIDKPINLFNIVKRNDITKLDTPLGISLYNGEIFDIVDVEEVLVSTNLNRLSYIDKTFRGQKLTITKINNPTIRYAILHIPEQQVNQARILIRNNDPRRYMQLMSDYIKKYPKLDYGYCMTIYKSQGSEFHSVFVNLNSVKWSLIGQTNAANLKKKISLFRTTYTAISRASDKIYCLWSK